MRRRKHSTKPLAIGDVLSTAFQKRGMGPLLRDNKPIKLWPQAVGPQIASQTQPDRLHSGTLFVRTTSSVWVQQLHFMKEDILLKINELLGKPVVRDIHFTVGFTPSLRKDNNGAQTSRAATLSARDKRMISESTDNLADRELAEILKRVMEKEISRRRRLGHSSGQ